MELFKTKSIWTGLGLIAWGVGNCYLGNIAGGGQSILGGLAVIFLRNSQMKGGAV